MSEGKFRSRAVKAAWAHMILMVLGILIGVSFGVLEADSIINKRTRYLGKFTGFFGGYLFNKNITGGVSHGLGEDDEGRLFLLSLFVGKVVIFSVVQILAIVQLLKATKKTDDPVRSFLMTMAYFFITFVYCFMAALAFLLRFFTVFWFPNFVGIIFYCIFLVIANDFMEELTQIPTQHTCTLDIKLCSQQGESTTNQSYKIDLDYAGFIFNCVFFMVAYDFMGGIRSLLQIPSKCISNVVGRLPSLKRVKAK